MTCNPGAKNTSSFLVVKTPRQGVKKKLPLQTSDAQWLRTDPHGSPLRIVGRSFREIPAFGLKREHWFSKCWRTWKHRESIGILEARNVLKAVKRFCLIGIVMMFATSIFLIILSMSLKNWFHTFPWNMDFSRVPCLESHSNTFLWPDSLIEEKSVQTHQQECPVGIPIYEAVAHRSWCRDPEIMGIIWKARSILQGPSTNPTVSGFLPSIPRKFTTILFFQFKETPC